MRFLLCCLLDVVSVGPKGTRTAALFIFFYISLEVASPPASATLAPSSWGRDSLCGAWSGTRAWWARLMDGTEQEGELPVSSPGLHALLHRTGNGPDPLLPDTDTAATALRARLCLESGRCILSRVREMWGVNWF